MTTNYRLFPPFGTSRLIDLMPQVLSAGLEPALFATIVKGRMDGDLSFDTGYDTGSAVLYSSKGNIKVGLDMETQREFWKLVHPEAEQQDHAIALPEGFYENASARLELSRKDIAHHDLWMTEAVARKNEVLMAEIPDQNLRETYIFTVFWKLEERSNRTARMDVSFSGVPQSDVGRLWCVNNLGDGTNADGGHYIDYTLGRLAGVAPKMQVVGLEKTAKGRRVKNPYRTAAQPQSRSIEEIVGKKIKTALDAQKPFEYNSIVYAPMPGMKVKP